MKNGMKYVLAVLLLAPLGGCTSMAQQGAMLSAYKAYEHKDFARCLSKASVAELYGSKSRVMDAQIMFYKAICLEGLGQHAASAGVLERLVRLFPDTDWAAAAAGKLAVAPAAPGDISY